MLFIILIITITSIINKILRYRDERKRQMRRVPDGYRLTYIRATSPKSYRLWIKHIRKMEKEKQKQARRYK